MKIPRGYVKVPVASIGIGFRQLIKDELTIVADKTSSFSDDPVVHHLYVDAPDFIGVPRGYYLSRLKHRGVPADFSYSLGGAFTACEREFSLREGQPEIVEKALQVMLEHPYGGVVIEAGVGSGKTILTLEIARRLGLKTMVVVPTSVLMEQWIGEIKKFFPAWKVGRVFSDTYEVKGRDVCVAMLQSIAFKDNYPEEFYEEFGTIIADETHLIAAPEFSKGLPRFGARYLIGASGTVKRKDKCEKVFIHTIGQVIPFLHAVKTMQPEIYFVDTGFAWKGWSQAALDRQRVKYLGAVAQDDTRNLMIVRQAIKAAKAGRNVLILSERVNHVKALADQIRQQFQGTEYSVGEMVGTSTKAERERAQRANVIVATVQLIGTGFNEPRLDVLIFASPVQNIDQCIGRVQRVHPGKKTPLVLDLVDTKSKTGMVFAMSRFKKYMAKGWKVHGFQCFDRGFLWKYRKQLGIEKSLPTLRSLCKS